ncbi:MAG: hypothetical protein IKN17_13270 [Ruminococcus sp.]|nr:hypothetical protein [Ruminococcus sp.]
MKKICALILSVIISAAAFVGCGDADSSSTAESKADTVSSQAAGADSSADSAAESAAESTAESTADSGPADVQSETDSDTDESKAPVEVLEGWGDLAKAYTEKLRGGSYAIDMTITSELSGEMPVVLRTSGGNSYIKMTTSGVEIEAYIIDGKAYSLIPSMNAYSVTENGEGIMNSVSTYGLSDNALYTGSEEKDGYTVENYIIPVFITGDVSASVDPDNSLNTKVSYYFQGEELKKIVADSPLMGETTLTMNSLSFDVDPVELPDISGMTKIDQDTVKDPASSVKMTMALLGITEDMVTKSGYTIDQLAALDADKLAETLVRVAKDNGIDLSDYGDIGDTGDTDE